MRFVRWPALAVAGVLAAVLVAPIHAQDVELKPQKKPKRDKYVITQDEIAEHPEVKDGYDVIRLLRNQWLRPTRTTGGALGSFASPGQSKVTKRDCGRQATDPDCTGAGSSSNGGPVPTERGTPYADADGGFSTGQFLPVIYVDDIKREGINDLRSLRPADVFEMRFLTGNQASGRYGSGHENGAILIKTVGAGHW